ncbi:hypothetical protein F2P81_021851 [Scophthalmus maximus]|uniref:Reverse transcriptase domain-containing protein n=1 Tax=Scophthalmus maximus TaxID=52904 RepID=A0A6A4S020_SCOMX|nr:hypothetical protein F2P81_021851 [Scophthalmus maximus]
MGRGTTTYDLVKSVYLEKRQTEFLSQRRGVLQGCNSSPTLFHIYTTELAAELDQCATPGPSLLDRELKSRLPADDLVLLSPTEQGRQQQLDIVEKFCQNWPLAVNMKKNKYHDLPKTSQMSGEQTPIHHKEQYHWT